MGVIYSPLLLITAYLETRQAHQVNRNRSRGAVDDDTVEEWENFGPDEDVAVDYEADGWAKQVATTKPNVETDTAVLEILQLKERVGELKRMVESLQEGRRGADGGEGGGGDSS